MSLSADFSVNHNGFSLAVAFALEAGERLAIVGPNGSGKSTLLAAICGHVPITEGEIIIDGHTVDRPSRGDRASHLFVPPEARPIAMAPQDGLLFAHLDVKANVDFGLRFRCPATGPLDKTRRSEVVSRALQAVDLTEFADRRVDELSGGQAQRVALARALALSQPVLLLDEPLSRIDVANRRLMRQAIDDLAPAGQIQLIVTHGPEHAAEADLVLALDEGKVVALDTPGALKADPPARWLAELFQD